jgi:NADPH:quinone reductase-like Zn-dependent oxidoreductase
MATQKAVQLNVASDAKDWKNKVFLTHDKPIPSDLGSDEVLIRLKCRPINPSDVMALCGTYADFNPVFDPATPGFEGIGYVDKIGSSVLTVKANTV